jgi:26S proteasome regulatory subunit N3
MAKAHNMASLRRDVETQASLLNSMTRDILRSSQVEQSEKLLSNSNFPETFITISSAATFATAAAFKPYDWNTPRPTPTSVNASAKLPPTQALAFALPPSASLITVQLLMGEIPERHVFFLKGMKTELSPYLAITQAVRQGDLAVFTKTVSLQATQLQTDGTYTLISRLAHQVVKAGLRKLHVSYSRLSLPDVADRLGLPSAKTAEYVVSKAVRDGVVDASIHHEESYVQSHDF